jgi:hypothetical protein
VALEGVAHLRVGRAVGLLQHGEAQPVELEAHAAANFNVAQIGDRIAASNATLAHQSAAESWDFISRAVTAAKRLSLAAVIDTYTPVTRPFSDKFGELLFAGTSGQYVTEGWQYAKKLTMPDLQWLAPQLQNTESFSNLASLLADSSATTPSISPQNSSRWASGWNKTCRKSSATSTRSRVTPRMGGTIAHADQQPRALLDDKLYSSRG